MIENKAEFDGTPGCIRMSLSGVDLDIPGGMVIETKVMIKIPDYQEHFSFDVITPERTIGVGRGSLDPDDFTPFNIEYETESTFDIMGLPAGYWCTFDFSCEVFDGSDFIHYKFDRWQENSTATIAAMDLLIPNNGMVYASVLLTSH